MASRKEIDWQAHKAKILAGLNLRAEFEALGIDLHGEPGEDGWAPCRAIDRDDRQPSAAVNCRTGWYIDKGGVGLSLSFWDLAVALKRFPDWKAARDHYAAVAGVTIDGKAPRDPAEHLAFQPWSEALVALWCRHKPGVTPDAVREAGGRMARYRDQYTVIALPIYGPGLLNAEPAGWVLWNSTGRELPIFSRGKDGKTATTWKKMKTTGGSDSGIIGRHAVQRLTDPNADPARQLIWKVEGPSDLLALWSVIPPEFRNRHLVLTNAGGATENPKSWMAGLFAGRHVATIGDADEPGQIGARKWATWAAKIAAEVRSISASQLCFEVSENHGPDVRDWIAAGHDYTDLLAIVDEAEVVFDRNPDSRPETIHGTDGASAGNADSHGVNGHSNGYDATLPASGSTPVDIIEADDDPHRLARINLERYATRSDGRTLRYWRDEWYVWKRNAYRKISERELKLKIAQSVREEFERCNAAAREAVTGDGKDPGPVQKVSLAIVSNVLQATGGQVCVSADVEPNTWLPTRQRRHYISMANGIIDLDALLAARDDYLLPNSPQWWSMVSLPYAFDPEAACPHWNAVLEHNLEMDPERIKVVQEWAGYLLTASTDEQKFMVLEGEGKNGKSVYIAAITAMLGEENVSTVALENFGDRFQRTDTIGKLLNAAGDCGDLDKTAEGFLKSFTAGDRMYFDRKGVAGINCTPTARLMIACNNRPRFSDRSDGIWRRMLVVPWMVEISKERRIKGMDKIAWWQASGELPGIFNWAVEGLARLRVQRGFTESEVMNRSLLEYKEEMNPARSYLQQNLEENASGLVRASEVYRIYRKWTEENGYHPLSERQFGKEVKRVFRKANRIHRGPREERYWAYEGIQFSQEEVCGEKTSDTRLF